MDGNNDNSKPEIHFVVIVNMGGSMIWVPSLIGDDEYREVKLKAAFSMETGADVGWGLHF